MSAIVAEFLANRTSEERKALLVELLRDLAQQSPRQPISIDDETGRSIGLFSPSEMTLKDDLFAEGSSGFFAELERRRIANDLVSADEALRLLGAGAARN